MKTRENLHNQSTNPDRDIPSRHDAPAMFDRIAHRYDLLNRVLSGGRDVIWRNRLLRHLPPGEDLQVLDVATGTADVLLTLINGSARVNCGAGIDLSERMLQIGRRKIAERGLGHRLTLQHGDAQKLPFADERFDVTTIAFGIRNVPEVPHGLAEMYRVLKPGGRALILEFSLPANRLVRRTYLLYFRHVLPRLGAMVSGDNFAYSYLNKTVETFPYGEQFCRLMHEAGFANVRSDVLTFGIATIYIGEKQ
jgi:demethylmenaquinone methyltransferase / 2-methoxy-6-polyprenyl-1,4-benzoquinol methylase